jgi:LysM repeat protein
MMRMFVSWACFLTACLFLPACSSHRIYLKERERLDQEISGVPLPDVKKTRQVIVIEPVKDKKKTGGCASSFSPSEKLQKPAAPVSLTGAVGPAVPQEDRPDMNYTVRKDDTLEKIARTYLGSHRLWTVIYEANRDVLRHPNVLKPGMVLRIPGEKNTIHTSCPLGQ